MEHRYLRYLFTALLGALSASIAYLGTAFVFSSGFSLMTEITIFVSSLLMSAAALLSFERFEECFLEKTGYSSAVYWLLIVLLIFLAVMVAYAGIAQGGTEYTEFMAQQAG